MFWRTVSSDVQKTRWLSVVSVGTVEEKCLGYRRAESMYAEERG